MRVHGSPELIRLARGKPLPRKVFAFESRQSGANPDMVEYIYFEERNGVLDGQNRSLKNTFRFLEIDLSRRNGP
jgi:hypothetical protein